MRSLDCRRLTGPNLLWERPSVILDVECTPDEALALRPAWEREVRRMHALLGWPEPEFCARDVEGGACFAFDAPVDRLYAGIAIGEWAWAECAGEAPDFNESASLILARANEEANPAMLAMQRAAAERDAPFLWDDDEVSVGHGASAVVWPQRGVPAPDAVDWGAAARIPAALITGTNGKTTVSRMAAHILRRAGYGVGLTSTEGVMVDDTVLDRGDYSGPGGARMVMRHPGADVAVLETARGGLLRRGLGIERADAALITNIAEDHLGDFGSRTMQELLDIKWIVARAVEADGVLVLNADDPLLVEKARGYAGRVAWFGLSRAAGTGFFLDGGVLYHGDEALCRVDEVPLTLGGAAMHNAANALAAAALCDALGVPLAAIRDGLTTMPPEANPGRGNVYRVRDFTVIVDFAHNPHATQAMLHTARAMPARRRLLAFSQAGDRTDALIREAARHGWGMAPDRVLVTELAEYYRGRAPGEVFGIIRDELLAQGARDEQVVSVADDLEALDLALEWAQPGDLVVMLALGDSAAVRERLAS